MNVYLTGLTTALGILVRLVKMSIISKYLRNQSYPIVSNYLMWIHIL